MPWLTHHNPEIDWRTGEVKITRCPEECEKQWRLKQGKSGWQKQKEKEKKKEEKEQKIKEKKKSKKKRTIKLKKVEKEWKIWDEEEEVKKLVLEYFYKWIHVFGKKQSERMPTRKL